MRPSIRPSEQQVRLPIPRSRGLRSSDSWLLRRYGYAAPISAMLALAGK